jgi:bifunctional N-acetylglucosamine-1-phosphate-uridyltransferase/glucosamine-1-phosphate-acetyltransferase GlmU-like protein
MKKIPFIIPAAGKSSRFKTKNSKIFYKIKNKTIIEYIVKKIENFSNKIYIVSNRENLKKIKEIFKKNKKIKILIQKKINGMATAINLPLKKINSSHFAVIWADQIFLKKKTISKTIQKQLREKNSVTFPVSKIKNPYTLLLHDNKEFIDILQKRETKINKKIGFNDCGLFVCQTSFVKKNLKENIANKKNFTKISKEFDFLHSLKYFNKIKKVKFLVSKYFMDTVGINKLSDLKKYEKSINNIADL